MKRAVAALALLASMTGSALSQQSSLAAGTWITLYMNDFKGVNFGSLSKNEVCVSGAREKVTEFQAQGMTVSSRVLMSEIAVFEATNGAENFMIYCNQNGVLLVDMRLAGPSSEAMARREGVGTETRIGDSQEGVTKVETDKDTGQTTTTTETPTK